MRFKQEGIKFIEGLTQMRFLLYSDLIPHSQAHKQDAQEPIELKTHINVS